MPQNVIETREDRVARVKASAMRGIQREMALKEELQAKHGPVSIMPLMIIDNEIWTADANGDWLQDMMDYEPCEEWNTIFLALDEETSCKLDVPMHPRAPLPLIDNLVRGLIGELREKVRRFPIGGATQGNSGDRQGRGRIVEAGPHASPLETAGLIHSFDRRRRSP